MPFLTDDKLARLAMLSLKAAGLDLPADMVPMLTIFIEEASLVMQEETGYDADDDAPNMGSLAKKQYAIWQMMQIVPGQNAEKARVEFEFAKNRWLGEAVRQAHSYENLEGKLTRDLARSGIYLHASDTTTIPSLVTEAKNRLEERTGYDARAYAVNLAEEAAYYYVTWKMLSTGPKYAQSAAAAYSQWLLAADAWVRRASVEKNEEHFGTIQNRLRMQDFRPNRTVERTFVTREADTDKTSSEVLFSKKPIALDDAVSTTLNVAVAITVSSNDTDPEGLMDLTSVVVKAGPTFGTTSVNATTGVITYTPNTGYIGTDEFTYQIADKHGKTATGTVTVTVTA